MTDKELAEAVNTYMAAHPFATRTELRKKLRTSVQRLERLQKDGLIKKVPLPLSLSAAATLNRKRSNLMSQWYINRPAPWQGGVR